jgi:hypothetical protein
MEQTKKKYVSGRKESAKPGFSALFVPKRPRKVLKNWGELLYNGKELG